MQKDLIAIFSETEGRILHAVPKENADRSWSAWRSICKDAEQKPLEELIDNDAPLKEQIEELFDQAQLTYEHYTYEDKFIVEIGCGDWKHDHALVDYLMETVFGMSCIQEKAIDESDDDCYSSVHYYSLRDGSRADENKIAIYTEAKQYNDDLKYWSNATADCYDCLTGECLSRAELPKELQPLYDYLSENYGMYTYLVQYKGKYGFALVNEYSEYTDEGRRKCINNFAQAKKVAAKVQEQFSCVTVVLTKQLGFPYTCDNGIKDPASELIVIIDAETFKDKDIDEIFDTIVEFLTRHAYARETD